MMLKKLTMGAALAALLASLVLAQTADPAVASGAVNAVEPVASYTAGTQSYANKPGAHRTRGHGTTAYVPGAAGTNGSVYSGRAHDGRSVGRDPDPNVRLQMQRDSDGNNGY